MKAGKPQQADEGRVLLTETPHSVLHKEEVNLILLKKGALKLCKILLLWKLNWCIIM